MWPFSKYITVRNFDLFVGINNHNIQHLSKSVDELQYQIDELKKTVILINAAKAGKLVIGDKPLKPRKKK